MKTVISNEEFVQFMNDIARTDGAAAYTRSVHTETAYSYAISESGQETLTPVKNTHDSVEVVFKGRVTRPPLRVKRLTKRATFFEELIVVVPNKPLVKLTQGLFGTYIFEEA